MSFQTVKTPTGLCSMHSPVGVLTVCCKNSGHDRGEKDMQNKGLA